MTKQLLDSRIEVEEMLVASLLASPAELLPNAAAVDARLFSEPKLRQIVITMFELAVEGKELTIGNIAVVSGISLVTLLEMTNRPTFGSVPILAKKLTEYNICELYNEMRQSKEDDAFCILDSVGSVYRKMQHMVDVHQTKPKAAYLAEFREYVSGKKDLVPAPFPSLNRWCNGGWPLGNITFLGGYPGAGKTSFAILCAMHAANSGVATSYIQAEMPVNEILERAQGIDQHESIDEINRGRRLLETARFIEKFERLPIEIYNTFERTAEQLNARCAEAIDSGSKLIVIDYLQIFTSKLDQKREFGEVKSISESCRKSALQRGVHYLVISSLNRLEVGRDHPTLASFYGGSQLGHDCAIGIILHSDDKVDQVDARTRRVHCDVVKNRKGNRGTFDILYDLPSQQMREESADMRDDAAIPFERGF